LNPAGAPAGSGLTATVTGSDWSAPPRWNMLSGRMICAGSMVTSPAAVGKSSVFSSETL
jgi:hypothetical protein